MGSAVKPVHYTLEFEPNLENFTFLGRATIRVTCSKPASEIDMDCADLEITSCDIVPVADGADAATGRGPGSKNMKSDAHQEERITPDDVTVDAEEERLLICLPQGRRIRGQADIMLEFSGVLNDRLLGFYRSRCTAGKGNKYVATTQFEAADARRAFPCWDRPDAKATFDIRIVVADASHTAISNMPVASKSMVDGKTRYVFATTPLMSTYLVYLGVGEFEHAAVRTENGTEIRIITTRTPDAGNKRSIRHAMKYAKKLLVAYEDYFGIRYPLPKLDLIAIPDFAAGAMENWGAITFRETLLLYDPDSSSTRTKQLIAEVISHELAHQWFGNLVTMKWWNDLWLNESFATFMATKLLDQMHPEWDLWGQFLMDAMNPAMELDSLSSTHPIDVPVESPAQIREIFDSISYNKGGCVLRMLEQYVGKQAFRRGLQMYLEEYKYGNASGPDLWRCIEEAAGVPVASMMGSWLKKPGFPVVHAEVGEYTPIIVKEGNKRIVVDSNVAVNLRQKRYVPKNPELATRPTRSVWPIPLLIRVGNETSRHMFDTRKMSIDVKGKPAVLVNPGRAGFYRVFYDDPLLNRLVDHPPVIESTDVWVVLNDIFAMCVSGDADMIAYMKFVYYFGEITDYATLSDICRNLMYLYRLSFKEWFSDEVGATAREFHRLALRTTGWNPTRNEKHTAALMRGPAIASLGRLGDRDTIEKSSELYLTLVESGGEVPADLVDPVCTAVARGSGRGSDHDPAEVHGVLTDLYVTAKTTEQALRYLGAMCEFKHRSLLAKTLDFAVSEHVRSQNVALPILRVAANPYGRSLLWPWLHKNWKLVSEKTGRGNPLLGRIISSLSYLNDVSVVPRMLKFFANNPVPGTERTLKQAVEQIEISSAMKGRLVREFYKRDRPRARRDGWHDLW